MMRESAVFLLTVIVVALTGALIATCAIRADAGTMRQQSVRLPMRCYAYEADEETGEPIRVETPAGMEYRLVASLAGVTRTLATIPCSELPRVVQIGGAWPRSAILGCVLDVCVPAR